MSQKKKKDEKDKGAAATLTPDNPSVKEVIPNRVSEATWEQWGVCDEQSESVADILQMILDLSWGECEYRYQSGLLIPSTVAWAMREMLDVVEWNFLRRDPGGSSEGGPVWREEEEPAPCHVDSWTRGKVPIRSKPITATSTYFPPPPPATPQPAQSPSHAQAPLLHSFPDKDDTHTSVNTLSSPISPKPPAQPRDKKAKLHSRQSQREKSPRLQRQHLEIRTLSECTSLPAPPENHALHSLLTQTTDQYLRVHKVPTVPSRRLPANKVTPRVSVLQPTSRVLETAKLKQSATLSSRHEAGPYSQLPEPLIDIIDPSPGVSVRQGGVVKRGPRALWDVPTTGHRVVPLNPIQPLEPIEPAGALMENVPRDVVFETNTNLVT